MISLIEIKTFESKNIPNPDVQYQLINRIDIPLYPDKLIEIPKIDKSIWIANDYFIDIIWKMIATCVQKDLEYLTAPQIGINKCFAVMRLFDLSGEGILPIANKIADRPFIVIINPTWNINSNSRGKVSAYECCSSSPEERILIERPYSIIANYISLNQDNENYHIIEEINGWRARVFQHIHEHFSNIKFLDYKS